MEDYAKINTPDECGVNMSNEKKKINLTIFKSLVGNLRYLTCTYPVIVFEVGLGNRFVETPTMTNFKALKQILWYIKGIVDFGLFYGYSNSFDLVRYRDSD